MEFTRVRFRSDSLPTEISLEKPTLRSNPLESTAPIKLPLCEINPHAPAVSSGRDRISLAESATLSVRLIMPRLLGPSIRTPPSLASATSLSCLARPSSPSSAHPLFKILTNRTRQSIQSRTTFRQDECRVGKEWVRKCREGC